MPLKLKRDGSVEVIQTRLHEDPPSDEKPDRNSPPQTGNTSAGESDSPHDARTVLADALKSKDRQQQSTTAEMPTQLSDDRSMNTQLQSFPGHNAPPQAENATTRIYDAKTILADSLDSKDGKQQSTVEEVEDIRTRIYHPHASNVAATALPAIENPPVGWLVLVAGPGQGHVATLGSGANTIGRDASQHLSLDFGDETISRTNHATITYDPRGKKFYIQQGGDATNLTYVNNAPVLAPIELQPHAHILIGNTAMHFVPLCGEAFSWETPQNA